MERLAFHDPKRAILRGGILIDFGLPPLAAQEPAAPAKPDVVLDEDGTVHVPAMTVPLSSFLSPEAKAYVEPVPLFAFLARQSSPST